MNLSLTLALPLSQHAKSCWSRVTLFLLVASCFPSLMAQQGPIRVGTESPPPPATEAQADSLAPKPEALPPVLPMPLKKEFRGHVELGFITSFPLGDFHNSDPGDPRSGYALIGHGLAVGLVLPFARSEGLGWYFGMAYTQHHTEGFRERIEDLLEVWSAEDADRNFTLASDYNPKYRYLTASTGFTFEGAPARVSPYVRLLANLSLVGMNYFGVNNGTRTQSIFETSSKPITGHSMEFGIVLNQRARVGVAWHRLGQAEIEFSPSSRPVSQNPPLPGDFRSLNPSPRIQTFEIRLGYTLGGKKYADRAF